MSCSHEHFTHCCLCADKTQQIVTLYVCVRADWEMRNVVMHSSVKHPTNTTTSVFIKHFLYFIWSGVCVVVVFFLNKEKGRQGVARNESCVCCLSHDTEKKNGS